MIQFDECSLLFSCGVLNVTEGCLFWSAVAEVDKVPTPKILFVGNSLVNVGVTLSIHIFIVVGGKLMNLILSSNKQG